MALLNHQPNPQKSNLFVLTVNWPSWDKWHNSQTRLCELVRLYQMWSLESCRHLFARAANVSPMLVMTVALLNPDKGIFNIEWQPTRRNSAVTFNKSHHFSNLLCFISLILGFFLNYFSLFPGDPSTIFARCICQHQKNGIVIYLPTAFNFSWFSLWIGIKLL